MEKSKEKNSKGFGYVVKEQQLLIGETSKSHQAHSIVSEDQNQVQRSPSASRVDTVSVSNKGKGPENYLSHLSEHEEKMLQAYATDFQHSSEISKSVADIRASGPILINNSADLENVASPQEGKDISYPLDPIEEEGELMDSEDIGGYDNDELLDSSEEKDNRDMEVIPVMGEKEDKRNRIFWARGRRN